MFLLMLLIILVTIQISAPKSLKPTLIQIHAISRHGDRAPVDTYPTDPFINETFAPYGWGQLTKIGMIHQYELGQFMRKKYDKFLGDCYTPELVSVQSTDTDRTKMSAQLQMAGLFPPKNDRIWNKNLIWQPIPINYEPLDSDKFLLMRILCPRYYELKDQIEKIKADENVSLYRYLEEKTRMHFSLPDDVQSLYSTLKAEEEFGLQLPTWTTNVYPSPMYELAAESFQLNAYNREMQKLKAGYLLNKILQDYHRKINHSDKHKMYVYVGHDSTIANLLIALGIWESQVPDYNAQISMELYEMKKEFNVKITFKNNTGLYDLKLPNCTVYCPLQKFVDLTKNMAVRNLQKECSSTTWRSKMQETGSP